MNKEIKPLDYDELECWEEDTAVCPYCDYKNYVEPEDYLDQDEVDITECDGCGKYFSYQINYEVSFTSEPLENYYLRMEEGILGRVRDLKRTNSIRNNSDTDILISHFERKQAELREEILPLLEEEE